MLAKAFDCIRFDVFARTLIKKVPKICVFVGDGTGKSPNRISQSHRWSLTRSPNNADERCTFKDPRLQASMDYRIDDITEHVQIHCCQIPISMDHG